MLPGSSGRSGLNPATSSSSGAAGATPSTSAARLSRSPRPPTTAATPGVPRSPRTPTSALSRPNSFLPMPNKTNQPTGAAPATTRPVATSPLSTARKLRLGPTDLSVLEELNYTKQYFTDRELELSQQISNLLAENGRLCKQLDGVKEKLRNVEAREISGIAGLQKDLERNLSDHEKELQRLMKENDKLVRENDKLNGRENAKSDALQELKEKIEQLEKQLDQKDDIYRQMELKYRQSEQTLNYKQDALAAVERENVALRKFQAEMREAGDRQLQRSSQTLEHKCDELLMEALDARRIAEAARGDRFDMEQKLLTLENDSEGLLKELKFVEGVNATTTKSYQRLEVGLFRMQVKTRKKKLLQSTFAPWRSLAKHSGGMKTEQKQQDKFAKRFLRLQKRFFLRVYFLKWRCRSLIIKIRRKAVKFATDHSDKQHLERTGFLAWKYSSLVKAVAVNFEKFETYDKKREIYLRRMAGRLSTSRNLSGLIFRQWKQRTTKLNRGKRLLLSAMDTHTANNLVRAEFTAWKVLVHCEKRANRIIDEIATANLLTDIDDKDDGELVASTEEVHRDLSEKVKNLLDHHAANNALLAAEDEIERRRSLSPTFGSSRGSSPRRAGASSAKSPGRGTTSNNATSSRISSPVRDSPFVQKDQREQEKIYKAARRMDSIRIQRRRALLLRRALLGFDSGSSARGGAAHDRSTSAPAGPRVIVHRDGDSHTISVNVPNNRAQDATALKQQMDNEEEEEDYSNTGISNKRSSSASPSRRGVLNSNKNSGQANKLSNKPQTKLKMIAPGRMLLQRCVFHLWRQAKLDNKIDRIDNQHKEKHLRNYHHMHNSYEQHLLSKCYLCWKQQTKSAVAHERVQSLKQGHCKKMALYMGDVKEEKLQQYYFNAWYNIVGAEKAEKVKKQLEKLQYVSTNVVHRATSDLAGHITESGIRLIFDSWRMLAVDNIRDTTVAMVKKRDGQLDGMVGANLYFNPGHHLHTYFKLWEKHTVHKNRVEAVKKKHKSSLECVEEYLFKRHNHELVDEVFDSWKAETRDMKSLRRLQNVGKSMAVFLDTLATNVLGYAVRTNGIGCYGGEYVDTSAKAAERLGVPTDLVGGADTSVSGTDYEPESRRVAVARRSIFSPRKNTDLLVVHPETGVDLASCHLRRTSINMHKLLRGDASKKFAGIATKKQFTRITDLSSKLISGHVPPNVLVRSPSPSSRVPAGVHSANTVFPEKIVPRELIYQEPATRPVSPQPESRVVLEVDNRGPEPHAEVKSKGYLVSGSASSAKSEARRSPQYVQGGRSYLSSNPPFAFKASAAGASTASQASSAATGAAASSSVIQNKYNSNASRSTPQTQLFQPAGRSTAQMVQAGGAITSSAAGGVVPPTILNNVPYPPSTPTKHTNKLIPATVTDLPSAIEIPEERKLPLLSPRLPPIDLAEDQDTVGQYLAAFETEITESMEDFSHFFITDLLDHAHDSRTNRDLCQLVFGAWHLRVHVAKEENEASGKLQEMRKEMMQNKSTVFALVDKNDTLKMAGVVFGEWKAMTLQEKAFRSEQFARQCALKVMSRMGVDLFGQQTSFMTSDIVREWAHITRQAKAEKVLHQEMEKKREQVEKGWKFAKTRRLIAMDDPDVLKQACFAGWHVLSVDASNAKSMQKILVDKKNTSMKVMKSMELNAKESAALMTSAFHYWKFSVETRKGDEDHEQAMEKMKQELGHQKMIEVRFWEEKSNARLTAKEKIIIKAVKHFILEHHMKAWRKLTHDEKYQRKHEEAQRYYKRAFKTFDALCSETLHGLKQNAMDLWKQVVKQIKNNRESDAMESKLKEVATESGFTRLQIAFAQDPGSILRNAMRHWTDLYKKNKTDKARDALADQLNDVSRQQMVSRLKVAFGHKSATMLMEMMWREWKKYIFDQQMAREKEKIKQSMNNYATQAVFTAANKDARATKTMVFKAWAEQTKVEQEMQAMNGRLLELKSTLGAIRLWGKFGGVADESELLKKFVELWHDTAVEEKKERLLREAKLQTKDVAFSFAQTKVEHAAEFLKLRTIIAWQDVVKNGAKMAEIETVVVKMNLAQERAKKHALDFATKLHSWQQRVTFQTWAGFTAQEKQRREDEAVEKKKQEAQKSASYRRLQLALAQNDKNLQLQILRIWKEIIYQATLAKTEALKEKIEIKSITNAERLLKSLHNMIDITDSTQLKTIFFKAWKESTKHERFRFVTDKLKGHLKNVQTRSVVGKLDLHTDRGKRKVVHAWHKLALHGIHEVRVKQHRQKHSTDKEKFSNGVDVLFLQHLAGRSMHTIFDVWLRYVKEQKKKKAMAAIAALTEKNAKFAAAELYGYFKQWRDGMRYHNAHKSNEDRHFDQKDKLIATHHIKSIKKLSFQGWRTEIVKQKRIEKHFAYLLDATTKHLMSYVMQSWQTLIHVDKVDKLQYSEIRTRKALSRVGAAFSAAHDAKLCIQIFHAWRHCVKHSAHVGLQLQREADRNMYLAHMFKLSDRHQRRAKLFSSFTRLALNANLKKATTAKLSLVHARNDLNNMSLLSEILYRWKLVCAESRFQLTESLTDFSASKHKLRKVHLFRTWRMRRMQASFARMHAEKLGDVKQKLLMNRVLLQWFIVTIPMKQLSERHEMCVDNLERMLAEQNFAKSMRPILRRWSLIAHRANVLRYYRNCRRELLAKATFASWDGITKQKIARDRLRGASASGRSVINSSPGAALGLGGMMMGGGGSASRRSTTTGRGVSSRNVEPTLSSQVDRETTTNFVSNIMQDRSINAGPRSYSNQNNTRASTTRRSSTRALNLPPARAESPMLRNNRVLNPRTSRGGGNMNRSANPFAAFGQPDDGATDDVDDIDPSGSVQSSSASEDLYY